MPKKIIVALAVVISVGAFFFSRPRVTWTGQAVQGEPSQSVENLPASWVHGKFTITPRARYSIKAVVLSKRHYWAGYPEDDLAPYDVALGWGVMSDARTLAALKISQDGRWYQYTWEKTPPIPESQIATHSSNNHLIAANPRILDEVKRVKPYDVVELKGFLVDVSTPQGWQWTTSTSRDDTAGGSCEILWVDQWRKI